MTRRQKDIIRALDRLPAAEKRAALHALRSLQGSPSRARALEAVGSVIKAAARGHAKRPQDRASDHATRLLIGARVPREAAQRYKAAADREGVSLYRWTVNALEAAAMAGKTDDG